MSQPQVAISRCLLGHNVRYDGKSKRNDWLLSKILPFLDIVNNCPEVGAGMSVPRPPIQRVMQSGQFKLLQVNNHQLDMTDPINNYSLHFLKSHPLLCGVITKSRSPSCGISDTPIQKLDNNQTSFGAGQFISAILEAKPYIPIIDEKAILLSRSRHDFLSRSFLLYSALKGDYSRQFSYNLGLRKYLVIETDCTRKPSLELIIEALQSSLKTEHPHRLIKHLSSLKDLVSFANQPAYTSLIHALSLKATQQSLQEATLLTLWIKKVVKHQYLTNSCLNSVLPYPQQLLF